MIVHYTGSRVGRARVPTRTMAYLRVTIYLYWVMFRWDQAKQDMRLRC